MQQYIGTKIIQAEPQAKNYGPTEGQGQPGYKVVYPDGYTSWSPAEAFEEAYRPCEAMNFGLAIEALKKGHRVARAGWNGKGMFLYYVPAAAYPAQRNTLGTMVGVFPDDMVPYCAYIAMKTAQENVVPWLASQTDVLADDWQIVSAIKAADSNDFPLGKACDLSGEGTCEACQ